VVIRFEGDVTWTDGKNPDGTIFVTFSLANTGNFLTLDVAHEGSHVADWQAHNVDSMFPQGNTGRLGGPTLWETEHAAYTVSSAIAKSLGHTDWKYGGVPLFDRTLESLPPDDREKARAVAVDRIIINGGYKANGKPLTKDNPGPTYGRERSRVYP